MRRRTFRALWATVLACCGGCASDDVLRERSREALVPPAVRQFSSLATGGGHPSIRQVSVEIDDDGWRPADTSADSARDEIRLSVGQTYVSPTRTADLPPLPPGPDDASNASPPTPLATADGKPIDLGTALALVAGQNPEVNFARARVRESYAQVDSAQALWLPSLQVGANYHHHDGQLQDVGGRALNVNRSALGGGFGAGALGAGSVPTPGLAMNFHLADAVLGPEIARRAAWATRHAVDASVNDQLLAVALAYLDLLEAHQQLAIALSTQSNIDDLARTTAEFAKSGQGLRADADRADAERATRRNAILQSQESIAVASARLAEMLRFDPTVKLQPCEAIVVPLQLCDVHAEPRSLVADALTRRPELREQRALVEAACQRLKREQYAPLVPSVLLGASYTGFGGGIGGDVNNFSDRTDFDALAYWQVRGLGFGERSARAEATARIEQARVRHLQMLDRVAREVVEAQAQVEFRQQQIDIANEAVKAAESSYRLNQQRIEEAQGLPIETLQAIQALDAARRDYLRAVTASNEAQFRLHRALGWPIHE